MHHFLSRYLVHYRYAINIYCIGRKISCLLRESMPVFYHLLLQLRPSARTIWIPIFTIIQHMGASQVALVAKNLSKNPPVKAGDVRDASLIPGLGRSPGGGHGNPLQYSCLGNPMDRGAWRAVHRVTKSQTWLKQLSMHTYPKHGNRQKQNKDGKEFSCHAGTKTSCKVYLAKCT